MFDVVTGFYPETKPTYGTPALRPCLVTAVYEDSETGDFACQIAFGTKHLKVAHRSDRDLIIQNFTDLSAMGLKMATRFDLDPQNRVELVWDEANFKPWSGYLTPKIGQLSLPYQKEYVWLMAKRGAM